MLAPIALFAFNRPEHLERTLDALAANELASESSITIFCDGARTEEEKKLTDATRHVARRAQGFASVTVIEREKNMGCAASVIDGLQYMFARHEKLIVFEDDILCSSHTLSFLNDGLAYYKSNIQIFNIAAWSFPPSIFSVSEKYVFDVYAIPRFNVSGGWASWRNRFEAIDWDIKDYIEFKNSPEKRKAFNVGGEDLSDLLDAQMNNKVSSWAIRADYSRFKHGQCGINPVTSYTTNIGFGDGTHTTEYTDKFDNDVSLALPSKKVCWLQEVVIDKTILANYQKVYGAPAWRKCIRTILLKLGLLPFIKRLLKK